MKKLLLIVGILSALGCLLCLLVGVFSLLGYFQLADGSAALYDRLQRRMIVFFIAGIALGAAAAVCFVLRAKL